MFNSASVVTALISLFGWIILMTVFAVAGLRDGSLRVADRSGLMVFRRRVSERLFCAMMGVFIIIGSLFQYGQGVIGAILRHKPVPVWAYFALWLGILIASGFGGLFLCLAGPRDLSLDLDRRTYRFTCWWPGCPHVHAGLWDDMAGIFVRCVRRSGQTGYLVEVAWRCHRRQCPLLGRFQRECAANALADELSSHLCLPRVLPPPLGKTSVDPVRDALQPAPPPFRPFRPSLFPPSVLAVDSVVRQDDVP